MAPALKHVGTSGDREVGRTKREVSELVRVGEELQRDYPRSYKYRKSFGFLRFSKLGFFCDTADTSISSIKVVLSIDFKLPSLLHQRRFR